MNSKVYPTFDAAVADIRNGSVIMIPGFGPPGIPRNLIAALLRKGASRLTCISNNHGAADNSFDVGTLIESGLVSKMICAFTATPHPSQMMAFGKLYESGKIDAAGTSGNTSRTDQGCRGRDRCFLYSHGCWHIHFPGERTPLDR